MQTTPTTIADVRGYTRSFVREWHLLEGQFQQTGYSYSQCHALFELDQKGFLNTVQISALLLLDKSSVSRLLHNLLKKGLVKVQKDSADQRQKWYSLTKSGQAAVQQNNCLADQQVETAMQLLSAEEQKQVRQGLQIYSKALTRSRMQQAYLIRPIQPTDNTVVARLIRQIMGEFETVGEGYSSADTEIDDMFQAYAGARSVFYVLEKDGRIMGCGGFGPLNGADPEICELRKMYFLPELRGIGLGKKLLHLCLDKAREMGYRECYLETVERMWQAVRLYEKTGFKKLENRCGDTGHCSCEAYYSLRLS